MDANDTDSQHAHGMVVWKPEHGTAATQKKPHDPRLWWMEADHAG
jgi:hypothetical protein